MSECQTREIMLLKYAEGLLDGMERGEVEVHLAGCPACQQWLEEYRRLKETMQSEEIFDRGDEYWERFQWSVLERIRERGVRGRAGETRSQGLGPLRWAFLRRYGAIAAGALMVFVLAVGLTRTGWFASKKDTGGALGALTDADIEIALVLGIENQTETMQEQKRMLRTFLDREMEEIVLGRLQAIDEQTDFFSVLQQLAVNGIKGEEQFYRELFEIPEIPNDGQRT